MRGKFKALIPLLLTIFVLISCQEKSKSSSTKHTANTSDTIKPSQPKEELVPTTEMSVEQLDAITGKEKTYQHYKTYSREKIIAAFDKKEKAFKTYLSGSCFHVAEKCMNNLRELESKLKELSIINTIAIMKTTSTDLYPKYVSSKYSNDTLFFQYQRQLRVLSDRIKETEADFIKRVQDTMAYFKEQYFCEFDNLTCTNIGIFSLEDVEKAFETADKLIDLKNMMLNEVHMQVAIRETELYPEQAPSLDVMKEELYIAMKKELDIELKTFQGLKNYIIIYLEYLGFTIKKEHFLIGQEPKNYEFLYGINPKQTYQDILARNIYLKDTFTAQINHLAGIEDKLLKGIILLTDSEESQRFEDGILFLHLDKELTELKY